MRIAFLGTGQMGQPMAHRLIATGYDVTVWNRTAAKTESLLEAGAERGGTPAEAVLGSDVAITMLADPDAVRNVVLGREGLAEAMAPGATLIEMSTVGKQTILELRAELPDGVELIDAPVLGSVPQAQDGSLQIFVGASDDAYGRWRELLSAFGDVVHIGPVGSGAAMKLVVNLTLNALMLAFGEAMALADGLDLDERTTLDVLERTRLGPVVARKRSNVENERYEPNFRLSHAGKDLRLIAEAAERAGIDLAGAGAAGSAMRDAERAGLGDCDYSAIVAHLRGQRPGC